MLDYRPLNNNALKRKYGGRILWVEGKNINICLKLNTSDMMKMAMY